MIQIQIQIVLRHLLNIVLLLFPPSRWFGLRRALLGLAGIDIADGACLCGGGWIYGRGRLVIGRQTWLSPRTVFYTHTDAPIEIGAGCVIAAGTVVTRDVPPNSLAAGVPAVVKRRLS